jgi:hypothetical protein
MTVNSPATSLNKPFTREDVLRLIPGKVMPPWFRIHSHLNRELIIGLIGFRGDGKSGSGASIVLNDFMFAGIPVWSNMAINCDLTIDDEIARRFGLNYGGVANFATEPLNKSALLALDERYSNGCIFGDEVNVDYSQVRRGMSNDNVDFNMVCQQLRHLGTSLVYTVIDEMFIDSQLRYATDVFIKCEDTALSADGLAAKKPGGIDFKWTVYPMSGYLLGRENSYYATQRPLDPMYFHFARFRGIYDTKEFQRKTHRIKTKGNGLEAEVQVTPDKELHENIDEWAWLAQKAEQLKAAGIQEMLPAELWSYLGVRERKLTPDKVGRMLPVFGITRPDPYKRIYKIENFALPTN